MLNRISRSFDLIKASAAVLRGQGQLLIFPLTAGLAMSVIFASFALPLVFSDGGRHLEHGVHSPLVYSLGFAMYLVNYLVMFYFNTALVACVMMLFDGGSPTVRDGLAAANSRFGAILGYAVIAATVGMLLRALQERLPFIGQFVVALVGAAWTVASFLVVPVLVAKNAGPIEAVRESAVLVKRTWGENVVGQVGMGLAFGIIQAAVMMSGLVLIVAASSLGMAVLALPIVALMVLAILAVMLVHTALTGIYSASLYRYAQRGDDGSFDGAVLRGAFIPK
jgi:hypothetical protein